MSFGKTFVVKALKHVGWEPKEGSNESHTDKLLRASVIGLLDIFAWNDKEVATEAKRRFDEHWENSSALPAEYKVRIKRSVVSFSLIDLLFLLFF
jgi:hypothetical protein